MGVELGRISGPLLASNLERNGIDLAFENDLLFLYVSNNDPTNFKIGVKTDTPGRLLDIANKLTSVNFIVDNKLTVPNFDIHTNEIQNLTGPIYISPAIQLLGGISPQIYAPALTTDNLKITDQLIKNLITGSDIELSPSGNGIVRFNSYEVNVNGSLHATGDVTWDGSITFGNDNTDNVNLSSDITSDIIPDIANTYDLGSTLKRWKDLYTDEIIATNLSTDTLTINNINLLLTPGNTLHVSKNGSDTNYGNHAHSTFATIKQALSSAVSGDTIIIFPGIYEEEFPLTVPVGVSVKGTGIRSVTVQPTLLTNSNDAFLLNGETTVSDLTVKDFYNKTIVTATTSIAAPIVIATPEFYSGTARNDEALAPYRFASSSGNYAIVGQSDANSEAGSAKIYNVTTGQLIHTLSDPAANQFWGQGVAIDGNYAVVTDYRPAGAGYFPWNTRRLSVFDVTTGNLLRSIVVDTGNNRHGPCVDISGNYAILGGYRQARIYDITTGNLVHTLINPITGSGWFGHAVAISGNYAVVGDPDALVDRGIVYIFDVTTGLLIRTINSPSSQTDNLFGGDVSTDGTHVIIGAPRHDTPQNLSGIAYIFDIATGNLVHTLINPNPIISSTFSPSTDFFGGAVSIDGNYAVVGAWDREPSPTLPPFTAPYGSGVVYVFDVTTGNLVLTWNNPNIDGNYTTGAARWGDQFGTSVSISGNTIIAVGVADAGGTTFITSILEPQTYIVPSYAFKYAPNTLISTRSPYVQNVTVITKGTVTSASDPRGFAAGDAGGGALIDGASVTSASKEASMLFHSATFITPGVDALVMTNGVRVEWLNSFTYFANRGTYLVNGTAGRHNQGTVFGAELRAINSANVYGTYGVVADGADTLAYLIGHNVGYVGTDGDYTNDPTLAIQANEVLQLNDGVIYFETTDHLGDIRVGDIFYVSQETGLVAFDAQSINIGAGGNITIESPSSTTIINELGYQTGNIRIYDNTISSLVGPVNFLANAGANTTYINTNVEITGSLGISSNLTADSNVYFGSDALDTITINADLTQDINPIATNSLYLGSASFRWDGLNSNILDVNGITQITSNEISTLSGNTDLKLQANGTGRIRAATNNVQIDNNLDITSNLTVNGATSLKDIEIGVLGTPNTLTLVGDLNQTGNTYITGTFSNNDIQITGNSYFQVPNIRLYNNVISNQLLDQDLIFTANGTGAVRVEKLDFVDNIISNAWLGSTTDSQKSIILSPNGSGNTVINSTKALKLPVGSNVDRTMLAPSGIRYNSTYNRYEGYQPTGLVSFTNMYSYDTTSASYITSLSKTTLSVTIVSINVGEYTIQVSSTAGLSVGFKVVSGPSVTPGTRITSIDGNILTFDLPTTNSIAGVLVFGPVILNFTLISGLQVGQSVSGTNIQVGTIITSWNSTSITMSLPISGNILIGSSITFGPVNSTYITPELTPGASDNILRFGINGVVKATLSSTAFATNMWHVGNIDISNNNIGQLTSADLYIDPDSGITTINDISIQDGEVSDNLNSEFLIQSTGQGYIKFAGKGAVIFPIGDDSQRRLNPVIGETRYNTDQSYLEVYNGDGWYPAIGTSGAASEDEIIEITNLWSLVLG